jgi:hypothetical protein
MRVLMVGLLGLGLVAGAAAAEPGAGTTPATGTTLQGIVIDNACASGHKDSLAEFTKTHTKDCALMPGCIASGYSLYTPDGKLHTFTKASNAKIVEFLKGKDSRLAVELKVKQVGKRLELLSIKNQA